jgi:hypothetical protein
MMQGGCLCGAVRFEFDHAAGTFELCHCNRCRKATGSAYAAEIGVRVADFADRAVVFGVAFLESMRAPANYCSDANRR